MLGTRKVCKSFTIHGISIMRMKACLITCGFSKSLTFRETNIHKTVCKLLYIQNTLKFLRLMKNEHHQISLYFTSHLQANAHTRILSDSETFIVLVSQVWYQGIFCFKFRKGKLFKALSESFHILQSRGRTRPITVILSK